MGIFRGIVVVEMERKEEGWEGVEVILIWWEECGSI